MNIEKLNDVSYCFKQKDSNNIKLFLDLTPSIDTNKISFSCVNLLLNNTKNVEQLLVLNMDNLEKLINVIPSQMKTLMCLNSFVNLLQIALTKNPGGSKQFQLLLNADYKDLSLKANSNLFKEEKKEKCISSQLAFNF